MVHLLMPTFAVVLQLAMNYTTTTVTVETNSTTVYNTTNSTAAAYTNQQLSRVVGEPVCTFCLHRMLQQLQFDCSLASYSSGTMLVVCSVFWLSNCLHSHCEAVQECTPRSCPQSL